MDYRPPFPDEIKTQLLKKGYRESDLKPHALDEDSWAQICKDSLLEDYWLSSVAHARHVDAFLKRQASEKKQADSHKERYARALWGGELPHDEAIKAGFYEQQQRWIRDFPQFITDGETGMRNLEVLAGFLTARNQVPTYSNVSAAFEALVPHGKIAVDLDAAGVPGYPFNVVDDLNGIRKLTAEDLGKILSRSKKHPTAAQVEATRQGALNADEFLAEHKELKETGVPDLLLRRFTQVLDTWIQWNRDCYRPSPEAAEILAGYIATHGSHFTIQGLDAAFLELVKTDARFREIAYIRPLPGETLRLHDQGGRDPGFPQLPTEDHTFSKTVRDMPSGEYWQQYRDDPAFRARVNALDR